MLLSPIGSPSKLQAFRCQPLPPLGFDDDDGAYLYDEEPDLRLPVELIFYIVELAVLSPLRPSTSSSCHSLAGGCYASTRRIDVRRACLLRGGREVLVLSWVDGGGRRMGE